MAATARRYGTTQQAMVSLLMASGRLHRALSELMERHDVTHDQYNVLRILRGAGAEGLPRYEISARMIYRASDVTRLPDRLESRNLVQRQRSAQDRRLSLTCISRKGLALLDALEPEVAVVHERMTQRFTAAERHELARLCDMVTD